MLHNSQKPPLAMQKKPINAANNLGDRSIIFPDLRNEFSIPEAITTKSVLGFLSTPLTKKSIKSK